MDFVLFKKSYDLCMQKCEIFSQWHIDKLAREDWWLTMMTYEDVRDEMEIFLSHYYKVRDDIIQELETHLAIDISQMSNEEKDLAADLNCTLQELLTVIKDHFCYIVFPTTVFALKRLWPAIVR